MIINFELMADTKPTAIPRFIRAIWLQASNGPDDSKLHLRPSKSQSSESCRRFLAAEVEKRLVEDEKAVVVISGSIEVLMDTCS